MWVSDREKSPSSKDGIVGNVEEVVKRMGVGIQFGSRLTGIGPRCGPEELLYRAWRRRSRPWDCGVIMRT
jgi:hypothetical protein